MTYTVSGIDLRITQGSKAPDDLRLEAYTKGRWRPVEMGLAFFLVDFFTENERYLTDFRPNWRQNGDRYFMNKCVDAWRRGWRHVVDELNRQRGVA